jgi:lincosamide nucleotidyltransferase A/C/D/E
MLAADVVALYRDFEDADIPVWLMGGWGVDALVGRQTRSHHDIDLLVGVTDLERFRVRLIQLGFDFKYVWDDEVRWVRDDAWTSPLEQPTAFVYGDAAGREVDVHVVLEADDGTVEVLWNASYDFSGEGWKSRGVIEGYQVRCLSREIQRRAHVGYTLPPHHVQDLQLLDQPT